MTSEPSKSTSLRMARKLRKIADRAKELNRLKFKLENELHDCYMLVANNEKPSKRTKAWWLADEWAGSLSTELDTIVLRARKAASLLERNYK